MNKEMIAVEEFAGLVEEEFELKTKGTLLPDTDYRDLEEWSSMYALLLIALVDRDFEVTITGDDLRSSNTIRDIYTLIQERT